MAYELTLWDNNNNHHHHSNLYYARRSNQGLLESKMKNLGVTVHFSEVFK